ncbi:hypothetical protein [Paenibacillus koleovorans]|uniref:hypothetical protein n=1 Tax=Paenibacillus koleovorans TaxID=121608 RepID=UPI000FD7C0A4|nr:hypothetical protein [Paenibacillus koleovorans]
MNLNMNANHYEARQWSDYSQGRLPSELTEQMEAHLYVCDMCLAVYTRCVLGEAIGTDADADTAVDTESLFAAAAVAPPLPPTFTDEVLLALPAMPALPALSASQSSVPDKRHSRPEPRTGRWFQSTWFHFTAAASITLVLMWSGVFQQLLMQSKHFSEASASTKPESVSERIMNGTFSFFEKLPDLRHEKGDSPQ